MRPSTVKGTSFAGNPIANILVVIAGALVIAASVVLGFFAFIALAGMVLITATVVGVRVWWLQRKMGQQGSNPADGSHRQAPPAGVIEGEYQVIDKSDDEA